MRLMATPYLSGIVAAAYFADQHLHAGKYLTALQQMAIQIIRHCGL
jgi:hypothetical protein